MPDNPRKKGHDGKRQSQQKHEVAYRKRKASRHVQNSRGGSRRTNSNRGSMQMRRGRSEESMTLREVLIEELADILNAERQILRALPKLAKAASSPDLRESFETHVQETQEQVQRIEDTFRALGEKPKSKKCDGMEGIIEEGSNVLEEELEGAVLDAALIFAIQKVEHYEIATYGTLCTWAKLLGEDEALRLLKQNMAEEEATDQKLTQLSQTINQQALTEGGRSSEANRRSATGLVSQMMVP